MSYTGTEPFFHEQKAYIINKTATNIIELYIFFYILFQVSMTYQKHLKHFLQKIKYIQKSLISLNN